MKKILLTTVLLLICSLIKANGIIENGTKSNKSMLDNNIKQITRSVKNISIKTRNFNQLDNKKSSIEKFKPTFTVDLLDGGGVHLFTISKFAFLPTMNIGAKINAGIKITI